MSDPVETVLPPAVSRPRVALPPGSCDSHMHVFGPFDRFPTVARSNYALPDAPPETHRAVIDTMGLDHAVLIQPSPYAADNRALLSALDLACGRLRGVASCGAGASKEDLAALAARGVVALRFVEMRNPAGGGRYTGTEGLDTLVELAPGMRAAGMHAQLWASPEDCAKAADLAARLGLTLVCDHLAGLAPNHAPGAPEFKRILDVLAGGNTWIKLTYLRKSAHPRDYSDMRPLVQALAEARPDRLLWGSDWPFVRLEGREPDAAMLVDQLHDWLGAEIFASVMRDNPAELFGFGR